MKQKTRILIYILIAAAVVIIGAITILSGGKLGENAREHLDLGRKYLNELSYDEAETEFLDAIRIDPSDPAPYIELARLYTDTGRDEMATDILETGHTQTGDEGILKALEELNSVPGNGGENDTVISSVNSAEGTGGTAGSGGNNSGNGGVPNETEAQELAEIPDLAGLSEEEAVSLCEERGFMHSISRRNSDNVKKGFVMEQSIPAGTMAAKGIGIPFAVSEGRVMVEIPDLSGLSEEEAKKVCGEIGIAVVVSYESSNDVPEGAVISQNIPAGAMAAEGASVRVAVSEGRKLEYDVELLEKISSMDISEYESVSEFNGGVIQRCKYPYIRQHGYHDGEAANGRVTRYVDGQYKGDVYYSIETGTQTLNLSSRYTTVNQYSEGLAFFIRDRQEDENGKVTRVQGYIDEKGQEVFSYTYERTSSEGSWGSAFISQTRYVNNYAGYENNLNMVEGYAAYHPNTDYYGFIDKQGNVIAEAKYKTVYSFTDGLAAVSLDSAYSGDDGKFGFIDTKGNLVIGYNYDIIYKGFENGAAIIGIKDKVETWEYKYGIIDKRGATIIPAKYTSIISAGEKFFIVEMEGKYGVVNTDGKEIVKCLYDYISVSDNDMIIVGNSVLDSELYGLFNSKGQMVLDVMYTSLYTGKPIASESSLYSMLSIVYGNADDVIIAQNSEGITLYDMQYKLIAGRKSEFYFMDYYDGGIYIDLFDPTGFIHLTSGRYMDKKGNIFENQPYGIDDILTKIDGTENLYITTHEFDGPFNLYRITSHGDANKHE